MHSKIQSKRSFLLLIIFLLGLVPGCSPSTASRSQDDALLLLIASHTRLSGDPALEGYTSIGPSVYKLSSRVPALAPRTTTELDILVDLYSGYLNTLRQQGNLTDRSVDRVVDQLQTKISSLQKRSVNLEQRRRRRGGGLGRFFRRVGRGIGRFIRRVGRAIGWAAEYLLEEVAPQVIRDMVLTGQPLTAKVFWSGVRKLVRKRLKSAVGTQLARRGVPVVLLERAGLAPGEAVGGQDTEGEPADRRTDVSAPTDIGYGNWEFELLTDGEDCGAVFEWRDFWDELPDNDIHDCRPALDSTFHIDFYMEKDDPLPLMFLLDSGELTGGFFGSSDEEDHVYERVTGSVEAEIEDGWVQPRADNMGWAFGGNLRVKAQAYVELRCWYEDPDPLVPGYFYWIDNEKTMELLTPFEGTTFQFVPGNEDEPGRLAPGGDIDLLAGASMTQVAIDQTKLYLWCEGQDLPADFPPPYVLEP